MALIFVTGQVAVGDPTTGAGGNGPGGRDPTVTGNIKDVITKVFKLTSANFTTGGTSVKVAVLPADASIINIRMWTGIQLAGGGITAATVSLGTVASGTQFVNAVSAFATAGTNAVVSPITGIMQPYNIPYGLDIQIWATGTATTGNPSAGEIYMSVEYVR